MQKNGGRLKIINELYKIARMGMEASEIIIPDVKHEKLKEQISKQEENYRSIAEQAKDIMIKSGQQPEDKNGFAKQMLRGSVRMSKLFNKDPQHIAEMMINGTLMGIIDMTKTINHFPDEDVKNKKLAEDYIYTEEKNIDNLKKYL